MSNPVSTAKEISRQLQNSKASAVITTPEQYSVVKESISGNPNIKLPIIVMDDANNSLPSGSIRFSKLISDSVEGFSESAVPDRNNEDTMFLPYSSGTTGTLKGVELSHRNVITNCAQIQAPEVFPGYETTKTHQDVVPIILPIFHIYGLVVMLMNYLRYGEVPKAFVVLRPGIKLDADAVKNFVAQNLPNYKQLGSVNFLNEIPKSAAGKILRRQLKDL